MLHLTSPTEPSTVRVSISGDRVTTALKVRAVLLPLGVRSSGRGEAWQTLLMWPVLPHVQHVLRSFFSRRRRCWGVALFAAAGMSVISSCFNCRATSASSSPPSFRVVTGAAIASVTSTAGSRSSWSASALTEETLALSVLSPLQMRSSRAVTSIASDLGGCTTQSGKRLREQPARVTSINPHAFTPLLFTPEKLSGEPL
ncbi:hypothetical protein T01_1465 [Trichinella spiralis]|uniref:Uncharacterized protein n=1 Tax=Trichinella spiralis TaxID=6334 RepID=A0A0V1BI57_TRISP|nr:hypothetical protein T01_1465 [Trichinella spiralis]